MKVYRITKKKYQNDLSGRGAELFGGRWNPVGTPALYTSESRALSILELLVHTPKKLIPPKYIIQSIEIPENLVSSIQKLDINNFEKDWDKLQYPEWTENLGLEYFRNDCLGIMVPSAIVKLEWIIVLNPAHQNYKEIVIDGKIEFELDKRLLK